MDTPGRRSSRAYWSSAYARFRQRLITARKAAGLTQRGAAARLGRSQSFVAKSESGERRVDIVELLEFARVYGRALTYFVVPHIKDLGPDGAPLHPAGRRSDAASNRAAGKQS